MSETAAIESNALGLNFWEFDLVDYPSSATDLNVGAEQIIERRSIIEPFDFMLRAISSQALIQQHLVRVCLC
jgi:hypothetical protein